MLFTDDTDVNSKNYAVFMYVYIYIYIYVQNPRGQSADFFKSLKSKLA